jgi:hypothetical protein
MITKKVKFSEDMLKLSKIYPLRQGARGIPSHSLLTMRIRSIPFDTWLVLLVMVAVVGYSTTVVLGPFDGDSGEFQYMPRLLGIPHPTGYPLYLLLGWFWSWLPIGETLALRLNLFSTFWAVITLALLFIAARKSGAHPFSAWCGALAMGLLVPFWLYAGLAAVYTLHTALLMGALFLWWQWSALVRKSLPATRWLYSAALLTGLALTNHPTALFLVPALLLFLLVHGKFVWQQHSIRQWLIAGSLFAVCGLVYLYVPFRLWTIGTGEYLGGLQESIAKGYIAPFLQWNLSSVLEYITGQSLLGSYGVEWGLLFTRLPALWLELFGAIWVFLGSVGSVVHARRNWRGWLLGAFLFVVAAGYAVTYDAEFQSRNQIAHLEGHLMAALLVFAFWVAQGTDGIFSLVVRRYALPNLVTAGLAIVATLTALLPWRTTELPTHAAQVQSNAIRAYWSEVLAYPLEEGAALTGHWGDLTAFWYFQNGEGRRPDLWAIFPPNLDQVEKWVEESRRPLYLAGPLLDWSPTLSERYDLTPWGILVRIAPKEEPPILPQMTPRLVQFGDQLQLLGYRAETSHTGKLQLWLSWKTLTSTSRDWSVSLRIHSSDGNLLLQEDGRLASLWYPDGTLPPHKDILTVFDVDLPPSLPPDTVAQLVVYDPATVAPLVTPEGHQVVELGVIAP